MQGICMNAAGNRAMEYGFDRGIWGGLSFVVTTRGNNRALVLFALYIPKHHFG